MFLRLKNKCVILFIIVLVTSICLCECKGGRSGSGSRTSSSSRTRSSSTSSISSSKGSGKSWFSSLFSSSRKSTSNSHNYESNSNNNNYRSNTRHINKPSSYNNYRYNSYGSSFTHNGDEPSVLHPHPNEELFGDVKPISVVTKRYGPRPDYSKSNVNFYNNLLIPSQSYSTKNLGNRQSSESGYTRSYPPPPPGFLNTKGTGGAAPSYTYNINEYISRGSHGDLTAGLALWELSKNKPHYNVYRIVKHKHHATVFEVSKNEEIQPGEFYVIAPNDVKCHVFTIDFISSSRLVIRCHTDKKLEIKVVLPSNKTTVINCDSDGIAQCSGLGSFTKNDMCRVDFKIFNETALYGALLCNTTVVNGNLGIVDQQYINGSVPCVYPPYKWTGKEWTTLEEDEQKEKIIENLMSVENLTNLHEKTLRSFAYSMSMGKLFDTLYNNNNK